MCRVPPQLPATASPPPRSLCLQAATVRLLVSSTQAVRGGGPAPPLRGPASQTLCPDPHLVCVPLRPELLLFRDKSFESGNVCLTSLAPPSAPPALRLRGRCEPRAARGSGCSSCGHGRSAGTPEAAAPLYAFLGRLLSALASLGH